MVVELPSKFVGWEEEKLEQEYKINGRKLKLEMWNIRLVHCLCYLCK